MRARASKLVVLLDAVAETRRPMRLPDGRELEVSAMNPVLAAR